MMKSTVEISEDWIRNSSLVRAHKEYLQEINLHKWLESEKAGHDIGIDRACVSWLIQISLSHID